MGEHRLSWLMLATHLRPGVGGGGMARYVRDLARAMARRPDVELSLLVEPAAAAALGEALGLPPERLVAAPTNRTLVNSVAERTGWATGPRGRFDVVHGTKHLVPRRTSAVSLLTVHDTVLLDRPTDFPLLKRYLLTRPYLASLAGADGLVAVSRAAADQVRQHIPDVSSRTSVVPLAMSSALLECTPVPVPGVEGDDTALVVSDFSGRKNLSFLLGCWADVRRRRPRASLVVVGPPPSRGSAGEADLAAATAAGGVRHLGPRSDGELRWLYQSCRTTICPSLVEGFGLPALEAVAFGCPVVTSADPALVEASGGRATVVATDDARAWVAAIARALDGKRARSASPAPQRTWDDVATETVDLARAVIAARLGDAVPGSRPDRLEAL